MRRAEIVEQLIRMSGYNIKEFSELAGVPYTTIRSIISRGIGNSSVDNVLKICSTLKITSEELEGLSKINDEEYLMGELIRLTTKERNRDLLGDPGDKSTDEDPDIRTLQRAATKMSPEDRKKAIRILEATFDDLFEED